jgi:hypothetical protein
MLLGNTIHVQYRRICSDDIPSNGDAQAQWLWNEWKNVDSYVNAHQSETKEQK